MLAVGGGKRLALHRLRLRTTKAERVRELAPPQADVSLLDVSISAGPTPTTCAVWVLGPADTSRRARAELRCYAWGDAVGVPVRAAGSDAHAVGISADGRSLAWANSDLNPTLRIGALRDGQVTGARAFVGDANLPAGNDQARSFSGRGVGGVAWAGAALAITVQGESDEGSGLRWFVPGSTQGGFLYELDVPPPDAERQRGYGVYDRVRSATSTTAWALERPQGVVGDPQEPRPRAVEVSLPTGRIKRVVSEPAEGREVVAVSGSSRAVVYVTASLDAGKDRLVYVRWAGQARGSVIGGLPGSTMVVAAA